MYGSPIHMMLPLLMHCTPIVGVGIRIVIESVWSGYCSNIVLCDVQFADVMYAQCTKCKSNVQYTKCNVEMHCTQPKV